MALADQANLMSAARFCFQLHQAGLVCFFLGDDVNLSWSEPHYDLEVTPVYAEFFTGDVEDGVFTTFDV